MLLGGESFEIYDINNVLDFWQVDGGTPGVSSFISAGQGRCGGPAYLNTTLSGGLNKGISFATPLSGYAGWAQKLTNFNGLERFSVLSTDANGYHLSLAMPNDGSVQVWLGGPSTLGGSIIGIVAPGTIQLNNYYHFGLEWSIALTTGYVRLYINGALAFSATNIRTVTPLYPVFIPTIEDVTRLIWGPLGYLCDVYWGDTAGPAPWNAFLGDLRVQGQLPETDAISGGSTYAQWTPSTGTDHGALVDDASPNDNTDYVSTNTVGLKETFKYAPIDLGFGTVYGVQVMPNAMKVDPGYRSIAVQVRSGGSDATGTEQALSQTTYKYYWEMLQTNPTGGNWTAASVDAAEFGVVLVA